jgi:hypothetical protein
VAPETGLQQLVTATLVAAALSAAAACAEGATATAVLRIPEKAARELRITESLLVIETPVAPGEPVRSGELLLTLDTRPLYRELEQAQAELAELQANEREHPTVGGSTRGGTSNPGNIHGEEMGNLAGEISNLIGRLEHAALRAPEDGYLVRRFYEVGAKAKRRKPGALFAPLAATVVEVTLSAADAAPYALGAKVQFTDPADDRRSFASTVTAVKPAGETFHLELNPLDLPFLLAGVPAEVAIARAD